MAQIQTSMEVATIAAKVRDAVEGSVGKVYRAAGNRFEWSEPTGGVFHSVDRPAQWAACATAINGTGDRTHSVTVRVFDLGSVREVDVSSEYKIFRGSLAKKLEKRVVDALS